MTAIEFDSRVKFKADKHGYGKIVEDDEGEDYFEVKSLEVNGQGVVIEMDAEDVKYNLADEDAELEENCEDDEWTVTIWIKPEEFEALPTFRVVE